MAEIWGAAIMVVGAVAGGIAAEKKEKAALKNQKAMTREEAILSARGEGYSKALDEFYREKGRFETQRGLDEFRKFDTAQNYMPGYSDDAARIKEPVAPSLETFFPSDPPKQKKKKKKKGGFRGFIDKYDPLGSKLIDIDPVSSAVLGKSYEMVPDTEGQARPTVILPDPNKPPTGG